MSLLRDFSYREVISFGGPWLLPDASMVTTQGALLARNVEYIAGQVGKRTGYKAIDWNALTVYTSSQLYAWYAPFSAFPTVGYSDSALVSFSAAGSGGFPGIQVINLKTRTMILSLGSTGCVSASMVGVGLRLYAAFHDANQRGSAASSYGVIFASGGSSNYATGPLLPAPWKSTAAFSVTTSGVGLVTAGVHRFGYIVEFASGFTTRASPDSATTSPPSITSFTPTAFTAAGAANVVVQVTPNVGGAPDAVAFSVLMTTASNLNQYYIVPGSRTAILGGSGSPASYTVSISDADLASQGVDATPYLYWLTATANAANVGQTAPFNPSHLCLFGDRMAYKAYQADNQGSNIDCLYVSERNNYQAITADQHLVMLPGQRNITTMFRMGGGNYIVGPHEIYSVTDTGDVPVTWPAPHLVDGRTGTLAIHGVEVAPSGQYAWIADQSGLADHGAGGELLPGE